MRQKRLVSMLCSLPHCTFDDPKIELEQYPTSPELAASIVLSALSRGDAGPGVTIADLGCGPGMLGLAFALAGSERAYLVDCDGDALRLARENVRALEEEGMIGGSEDDEEEEDEEPRCRRVEIIQATVKHTPPKKPSTARGGRSGRGGRGGGRERKGRGRGSATTRSADDALYQRPQDCDQDDGIPLPSDVVDTVITNPPFGTKHNEGIDVQFLKTAIRLAKRSVYSFHKTSTRSFLLKLLERWGLKAEVVAEMRFDIGNTYKFHKQKSVDVEVDLLRVWFKDDEEVIAQNDGEQSEGEEMPLGLCGHE